MRHHTSREYLTSHPLFACIHTFAAQRVSTEKTTQRWLRRGREAFRKSHP